MLNFTETRTAAADIVANGGLTWAPGKVAPVAGYMVSLKGTERMIPLDLFCAADLAIFAMDMGARVARDERAFFGAWVDGEHVYLDVSLNLPGRAQAIVSGLMHDQLAIFDVAAGEVIDLRK
jgi:hypothetical protein